MEMIELIEYHETQMKIFGSLIQRLVGFIQCVIYYKLINARSFYGIMEFPN